ncbi:MAG: hypothetical protein IKS19_07810 [Clostridia bacterium]|nr:hypothetical protein [Clostridia bacterium]
MIDIHCHILPDIDDGAKDMQTSLKMCAAAIKNGVDAIVATPHFLYFSKAEEFFEKRSARLYALRNEIDRLGMKIKIFAGAEVAASDIMFGYKSLERLTINGSRYILLELPFTKTKEQKIYDYVDYVFGCGLVPIMAHPERFDYTLKNYDIINNLADRGCCFQINAGSAAGHFGRRVAELSNAMIKSRLADFIATDAHFAEGTRSPELSSIISEIKTEIPEMDRKYMTSVAPLLVLQNKVLPDRQPQYIEKRRFSL